MTTETFVDGVEFPSELLHTKLYIPKTRDNLVSRPRLLQQLNKGLDRKLLLISAPAGFGKTTLMSDWILQSQSRVAWVSLDESDNDLDRLLQYIIAALQTTGLTINEPPATLINTSGSPEPERRLTNLINEIARLSTPLILVLDDYHLIHDGAIHAALSYILEYLPSQMLLTIISRTEPPIGLPRLRGRNEVIELRENDLRFTDDEAQRFLNDVMGLDLVSSEASALGRHTEGWITGLQLAALSLMNQVDTAQFIDTFSGTHRHIFSYLAEEVFARQPDHIQQFLLQTSILDRLTGTLCDAMLDRSDSDLILRQLDTAHLFLTPLNENQTWYRYHQLFAEFLRDRLARHERPEKINQLHHHASLWYEQHGIAEEAIEHAFNGHDFERATALIEGLVGWTSARSQATRLLRWLDELAGKGVRSRPRQSVGYAWSLLITGHLDAIEPHLVHAEQVLNEEGIQQEILGQIITIRAIAACYRGDPAGAIEFSRKALQSIPKDDLLLRSFNANNIALNLGSTHENATDLETISQIYAEAATDHRTKGDIPSAIYAMTKVAEFQTLQGHLQQAATIYHETFDLILERNVHYLPGIGKAHIGLAEILYEWNELEKAGKHLEQGIAHSEQGGDLHDLTPGLLMQARVLQAQGEIDQAHAIVDRAERLALNAGIVWMTAQITATRVRLWLAGNDLETAVHWADKSALKPGDTLGYRREGEYLSMARVLIAQRDPDAAMAFLEWLFGVMEKSGLIKTLVEVLVLQSLALHISGHDEDSIKVLKQALRHAESQRYIRTFVDEGQLMFELSRKVAARGIKFHYVNDLLHAFTQEQSDYIRRSSALIDPVSERELEVLRLVSLGLSNKKIAEELVLAVGTVKAHLHNIHSKLGARNRTEAVAKAREFDLLN